MAHMNSFQDDSAYLQGEVRITETATSKAVAIKWGQDTITLFYDDRDKVYNVLLSAVRKFDELTEKEQPPLPMTESVDPLNHALERSERSEYV